MKNRKYVFGALCLMLFVPQFVRAQEVAELALLEDSIQSRFVSLISAKTDSARFEINKHIENLFDVVLEVKASFDYPFDKLKNVSKLSSDDGFVRIINWNVPMQNGEYVYYAYVQCFDKKADNFKLYKLKDNSENIENPEFAELSANNWFGGLYYYLRTDKDGKNTYYTLFGWDGNSNFSNKKIIECFQIENEKLVLGLPVFKMENATKNRLIFEFAKQAKMMVRYDDKIQMVVYDHLAPSHKNFEGQFMYYGPDMSQDGLKFIDGYWQLKPNLDLRNMEESTGKSIKKSF